MYEKELDFLISTSYGPGRYDPRYEIEGLDYPAIAAMLGVPLGTVKTLIFRGKRMLKDRVSDAL